MKLETFGRLDEVARITSHEFCPQVRSPDGRYVGVRRGLTLMVVDTQPAAPVVTEKMPKVFGHERLMAIHPDGERVAMRSTARRTLEIRHGKRALVDILTDTVHLSWDGKPIQPGAERPRWGYADEQLSFTSDGAHLVLATHDAQGAVVYLLSADTLELVDSFRDLRLYSPYAVTEGQDYAPLKYFSESWLGPEPLAKNTFLGVRNAGDSCMGVYALEVVGGAIKSIEPAALSRDVFAIDAYCIRGLRLTPHGLLVVSRDHEFAMLPWPPAAGQKPSARAYLSSILYEECEFPVPTPSHLEFDDELILGEKHLLTAIRAPDQERTVGLLVLDAATLATVGFTPMPRSRARVRPARLLDAGLVAVQSSSRTTFYRFFQ